MVIHYANEKRPYLRLLSIIALEFTWVIGILSGYFFYKPSCFPLMRSVVIEPVSIVGLFSCIFLPLLCSCVSIVLHRPIIILVVCFIKAVAFGFSCGMLAQIYASSAWLIRFLFLFSDSCCCILLHFLWLRRFTDPNIRNLWDIGICAVLGVGIALIDGFIISPFLQGLF